MNETSWKRLIAKIRESNVVPIIGPRLLDMSTGTDDQAPNCELQQGRWGGAALAFL